MAKTELEIKFKRDTSFRKQFFVPDSFAHPAKMDAQLLIWLTENYTSPGEVILDPMAGSGTTMLACTLGRHCILVELEEKFCKMMSDNWQEVRMRPQLGYEMGNCQIIQGDARNLESFLGRMADKIITSPPYADTERRDRSAEDRWDEEREKKFSGGSHKIAKGYQADKIITSPPYTNRMDGGVRGPRAGMIPYTDESPDAWFTQRDQQNIGNLPYGNIDKIITSPPYEGMKQDDKRADDPEQIDKRAREFEKVGGNFHTPGRLRTIGRHYAGYACSSDNIGNLKGDTYLEAMALVYSQCFTVLRPGGLMILVTKNFIRDKQVVRLDSDTIKLTEQVGFSFVERHFRILPSQSFWRTIYQQRYPDVEVIQNEDILVFGK